MNYNHNNIMFDRKSLVSNVLQSWINVSFKVHTEHPLGLQWKCHIFCLRNMSTFTQHRVQHGEVKQIGTVGLCWTILLVTIYHFFIGHKWSTSVSTWLSFHTKYLNRDSSPISVAPLLLFKPTCVSYIKP